MPRVDVTRHWYCVTTSATHCAPVDARRASDARPAALDGLTSGQYRPPVNVSPVVAHSGATAGAGSGGCSTPEAHAEQLTTFARRSFR